MKKNTVSDGLNETIISENEVKGRKGWKKILAVIMILVFLGGAVLSTFYSLGAIDDTPYKNTKYFVEWDNYVFSNVPKIKSQVTKDYIAFKSMDNWASLSQDVKTSIDALYNVASTSRENYLKISRGTSKKYYSGYTKSNLSKLRDSLLKTKALYTYMENALAQFDVSYLGYYSEQMELVNTSIKYLSKSSINAISAVSKSYGNKIPKKYFKVSYKTVHMPIDGEVEAYNSLYTPLVRGAVTLVYNKSDNLKYNDTVVSLGSGKGYIIYPMSLVGRVRYVKVTYICE